jgi:thymidine phosphorylase
MLLPEIIRRKREGGVLTAEEIAFVVDGIVSGTVAEGQIAALAMAVFFRGMSHEESIALTLAMRDSGHVLDWSHLDGPVLDKHSTGGVGDNVSLILAPAVAACGAYVPMIAGRGLGHTGGTLDKLDSIPGYVSQPERAHFRRAVAEAGASIIGQTADLAPADRHLYAIRDVTATVESIPLITASILSKKLAAGLDALVLDVKSGSGAFMRTHEEAKALATSLVAVANGTGLRTVGLITDKNQPLASAAGNAVEVMNAVAFLTGRHRDPRLHEVTVALAAELLVLGGLAADTGEAAERIAAALDSGAAAEVFARMVAAHGGPADFVENPGRHLAAAPVIRAVSAPVAGFVQAIDTRAVGIAVVELGGGRSRATDPIDYAVGFTRFSGIGLEVGGADAPLALVHARTEAAAERASAALRAAYAIGEQAVTTPPPVLERVSPKATEVTA